MVFSFFTKNIQDKNLALLVDIGSSSVGCALARMEKGKAPHIIFTVREDIPFQESLSSAKFLLAMNHALERVLKAAQSKQINLRSVRVSRHGDSKSEFGNSSGKMSADSPSHIFCTLSSPWFILKNRHLHIEKKEPFQITEKILDVFLSDEIESMKDELRETLPPADMAIIERKIIQIKLNGYDIKNPYGQKTSQLEIVATIGVSSKIVIQSIERKIGQYFHTSSLHFSTFPVAAFNAVRDIFPTENNFLFLDITGEATDVSLVVNDLLIGSVSFPRGKNFFIREISTQLRTIHEEAATIFAMYLRGELPSDKSVLVEKIVLNAEKDWLTRFVKATSSLASSGVLPRKIFFTADADIAQSFLAIIAKAKPEFLLSESFEVQYIDQHIVAKFVSFETEVLRDPFIVVEALLAEKLFLQYI